MKLAVIGGHSRNIGKTSLMCGIISASRGLDWTALKITQFGHGVCSTSGHDCGCSIDDPEHPFAITRETDASGSSDTSRFLAAGAQEVFWVRTPAGELERAMPALRKLIESRRYVIIESNSILRFVHPDVYLPVLDYGVEDFKLSSRLYLSRADAYALANSSRGEPVWSGVDPAMLHGKPCFRVGPPRYCTDEAVSFVVERLGAAVPSR